MMEWKYLIALSLILFGCLGQNTATGQASNLTPDSNLSAPPANQPFGPGDHFETLEFGGYNRTFIVYVPRSYDGSRPYPLVVVLHGAGGRAESIERTSGFNRLADDEGFIAVYPQALGDHNASKTFEPEEVVAWGAGEGCCGFAGENGVDDIAFIGAMLDYVEGRLSIDKQRVYAAGLSNGGMMSYALGCRMSDRFAAIAPVAGWMEIDCKPAQPMSVVAIHGTADRSVPYEGGTGPVVTLIVPSVRSEIDFWSVFNGCDYAENATVAKDVTAERHYGCRNGTGVLLYKIEGGGHVWPGPGAPGPESREINAAVEIWKFFRSHPKSMQ